jgi:predicted kinase
MMFSRANDLASQGKGVIMDASFISQKLRMRAAEVAAQNSKTFVIQQTQCPEEYSLNKISKRTKDNYESNALTPQAYFNNKERFEPVDLDEIKARFPNLSIVHLVVDTASDAEDEWYVIEKIAR